MIVFNSEFGRFYTEYYRACKKYDIATQNKATLLYDIALRLEKVPMDGDLRQLLLLALADDGILLSHFEQTSEQYIEYEYQNLRKRYVRLAELYTKRQVLAQGWQQRMTVTKLPEVDAMRFTDENAFAEEANHLTYLYRSILEVSERNSPELYTNLRRFLCLAYQLTDYSSIIPLFLFQIMVRHTSRLATKENLRISLQSLWSYREYKITMDNEKNYKQYKAFSKLFRKICKYFRGYGNVDLELCRYGFGKVSNLGQWVIECQPTKRKRILDKFSYYLLESNMTCIEYYEPETYTAQGIFGVEKKAVKRYIDECWNECVHVEETVRAYLESHVEYILAWKEYLYVEAYIPALKQATEEIYRACVSQVCRDKLWLEPCIKAQIYEVVVETLDMAVRYKVSAVLNQ